MGRHTVPALRLEEIDKTAFGICSRRSVVIRPDAVRHGGVSVAAAETVRLWLLRRRLASSLNRRDQPL